MAQWLRTLAAFPDNPHGGSQRSVAPVPASGAPGIPGAHTWRQKTHTHKMCVHSTKRFPLRSDYTTGQSFTRLRVRGRLL